MKRSKSKEIQRRVDSSDVISILFFNCLELSQTSTEQKRSSMAQDQSLKPIIAQGKVYVDGELVDGTEYNFKGTIDLNDKQLSIDKLLGMMNDAQNAANNLITNEMDKEKNKEGPPLKRQRIERKQ